MRHRYPFESLHWLRQQRVDREASALCEGAERAAHALRQAELARAIRSSAAQRISRLAAAEQRRLDDGLVRACELQTVADWQKGAALELAAKTEQERCAREAQEKAAVAEASLRRALATASNEATIIDSHREAFRAQRAAEQELSEEEAASEQWTARHFSSRRG